MDIDCYRIPDCAFRVRFSCNSSPNLRSSQRGCHSIHQQKVSLLLFMLIWVDFLFAERVMSSALGLHSSTCCFSVRLSILTFRTLRRIRI